MRKALGMVLSLLLACMPVFAAQEADRTRMSKDHQRAYDAALALYGTYNGITHFLCSTTVVAEKEVASQTGKQHEYLLLTAGHCIVGEGLPVGLEFGVRPDIKPESPKPELEPVQVLRAENDAKFDFALLSLVSSNVYPSTSLLHPKAAIFAVVGSWFRFSLAPALAALLLSMPRLIGSLALASSDLMASLLDWV